MLLYQAWK